jgi:cAMP deaminase
MSPLIEKIPELPKCELHIHAEAVVSAETYFILNKKYGAIQGIEASGDFHRFFAIKSLKDMISSFYLLQSLFRSLDDYRHMAKDVGDYCRANDIVYAELHFAPSMVKRNGYVAVEDVYGVLLGEFRGMKDSGGPAVELIVDLSRSFGLDNAAENLTAAERHNAKGGTRIIGVGLGGQERGNSCLPYKRLFQRAQDSGLHVVIHAGEETGPESIWEALECGAQRIGHATSACLDRRLLEALRERRIPIEVCLTSNVITGKIVSSYADHPLGSFLKEGLSLVLNTDDPVLFDTSLNAEYGLALSECGIGESDLLRLCRNAFLCSFSPEKERLVGSLDSYLRKNSLSI